jgi:hypothetical protein
LDRHESNGYTTTTANDANILAKNPLNKDVLPYTTAGEMHFGTIALVLGSAIASSSSDIHSNPRRRRTSKAVSS